MLPDPGLPGVYLCVEPVDFGKAIQGLSLLVEQEFELNPFEATLFVFINRAAINSKYCTGKRTVSASGTSVWKSNASSGLPVIRVRRSRSMVSS
ncbi:MAG: hypothetical protein ACJA09_003011 [Alcanivorax sp.]|jgi:hypothetical protein